LKDDDLVARIQEDFRTAGLSERDLAMLEYVQKLTLTPGAMNRSDIDRLRNVGFDDADILAIAEVTGYYAYVNRIADGLGVEVEDWFIPR
jgi:uncharacterized peroxidase-related enzyme